MYRVGVDIGGTNIALGIVNDKAEIIRKKSLKTGDSPKAMEMINAIAGAIKGLISEAGITETDIAAVGVCVPGTAEIDTGKILYANNLGFEDVLFIPELQKLLGSPLAEKVYFENDANAAAIGEYITGSYTDPVFVMVTLGTGIGGGIIINGKLLRGCNYAAAEFGHMTINYDGCDCNCGRKGCFEDYASATALIEQAKEAMQTPSGKDSALWQDIKDISELNGEKFFAAVKNNDETALGVLDRFSFYLAEGLINIINMLQPDVLVLSGGITRASDLYLDKVKEKVAAGIYSRNSKINTRIVLASGISDSGDVGIVGAAMIDKMQ